MILRETLKQEIDQLNENQLGEIAEFVASMKNQTQPAAKAVPFWQRATPIERAIDFRTWVAQLPKTDLSLPDDAFDRGSLYE
ncbi:MAG: hypothetical protein VKL42_00295 [Snowella sp.]|nr:hypothetical protein [Snowella sp.]